MSCGPLQKNEGVIKFPTGNNYLQGAEVTFTCQPEYFRHGAEKRKCLNGTWSPGWWAWCRGETFLTYCTCDFEDRACIPPWRKVSGCRELLKMVMFFPNLVLPMNPSLLASLSNLCSSYGSRIGISDFLLLLTTLSFPAVVLNPQHHWRNESQSIVHNVDDYKTSLTRPPFQSVSWRTA